MRLLIVEDDAMILRGLVKGVDWNRYGFDSVRSAPDGEIGLSMMRETPADIVITDINMPFMDGLELSEAIRREFPSAVVIILTGYQKFEYAQTALHVGVFDYLMKPISSEQLDECMKRAISHVVRRVQEYIQIQAGREKIKEDFLTGVLFHGGDLPSILDRAGRLGLSLKPGPYHAAVAHFDDFENPQKGSIAEWEEAVEAVIELCDTIFSKSGAVWRHGGEYLNIIWQGDTAGFRILLEQFVSAARSDMQMTFVIAAGTEAAELSGLHAIGHRLREFHRNDGVIMHCSLVWCSESSIQKNHDDNLPELSRRFIQFIYEGKAEECHFVLSHIAAEVVSRHDDQMLYGILFHLSEICRELIRKGIIAPDALDFSRLFDEFANLDITGKFDRLGAVSDRLCRDISISESADSMNSKMLDYIARHYTNQQLSLTALGDYMDMSPVYLCSVFKKKNGISFSEYVTDLRMREACRLLADTSMKAYEISSAVGIPNQQYFSSRFRKIYGVSPMEFREGQGRKQP